MFVNALAACRSSRLAVRCSGEGHGCAINCSISVSMFWRALNATGFTNMRATLRKAIVFYKLKCVREAVLISG